MAEAAAAPLALEAAPELAVVSLDDVLGALRVRDADALEHPDSAEHAAAHANDAAALAARALAQRGALALTLPPTDAEALRAALRASDPLFAGASGDGPLPATLGGCALLQYRGGSDTMPAGFAAVADRALASLDAAGRVLLRALNGARDLDTFVHLCDIAHPISEPVAQLESLLKPLAAPRNSRRRKAADSESSADNALTFQRYAPGAEAAPRTDSGLLTLVFAEQAGLEVCLRGSETWTAPALTPDTVLVFVGECLQLATGNMMRACMYRVARAAAPLTSLVMSLNANPEAPLPLVYGRYWRCATVREFNARFAASQASAIEPAPPRILARRSPRFAAPSIAEYVLALPGLAAAIVEALGNDIKALAAAERVCVALRDAVAPHWRRLCLRLVPPLLQPRPEWVVQALRGRNPKHNRLLEPALPQCIVSTDARQWCALFGGLASTHIHLRIVCADEPAVHFRVGLRNHWRKIADAYCVKKGLDRALVHFSFNGRHLLDADTVYELRMSNGTDVDATVVQAGA